MSRFAMYFGSVILLVAAVCCNRCEGAVGNSKVKTIKLPPIPASAGKLVYKTPIGISQSPDGKLIAYAYMIEVAKEKYGQLIYICNLKTGTSKVIQIDCWARLKFVLNGRWLCVAPMGYKRKTYFVNPKTGEKVGPELPPGSPIISTDGKQIAIVKNRDKDNYDVYYCELPEGEITTIPASGHGLEGIRVLPGKDRLVITGGNEYGVGWITQLWDMTTKSILRTYASMNEVASLRCGFGPKAIGTDTFYCPLGVGLFQIADFKTGKPLFEIGTAYDWKNLKKEKCPSVIVADNLHYTNETGRMAWVEYSLPNFKKKWLKTCDVKTGKDIKQVELTKDSEPLWLTKVNGEWHALLQKGIWYSDYLVYMIPFRLSDMQRGQGHKFLWKNKIMIKATPNGFTYPEKGLKVLQVTWDKPVQTNGKTTP